MKQHSSRSIGREGTPLHAAAHSHHAWSDVTRTAQTRCWEDTEAIIAHLAGRDVIVDCRGDRLRFGFAIYHGGDDARAVAAAPVP